MTTDENGNPIPQVESVVVNAMLREDLRRNPENLPGLDQDQQLLKGFLTKPTDLPTGVAAGVVADCALTEAPGRVTTGKFEILYSTQNPFIMAAGVPFLTKIRGIFRPAR